MSFPSVPSNSIVEKLLKQESAGIIELVGYPAPHENGIVRIYRDLCLDRYAEIPQDAILEFIEPTDPKEPTKIFIKKSATITYTQKKQVSASASVTSMISFTADEVKRATLIHPKHTVSPCSSEINPGVSANIRRPVRPGGGGNELPPEWCEINCEQAYNICLDIDSDFWCSIDYYLCLLGCFLSGSKSSGGLMV